MKKEKVKESKNKVGCPLKFETPEQMQIVIDEYFKKCDLNTKEFFCQKTGKKEIIKHPIPYTVEGLSNALDIDRKSIINYSKRDEFFHTVKKAKDKILQNLTERGLMGDSNPAITIFNKVNNFGYSNRQEHTGPDGAELFSGLKITLPQPDADAKKRWEDAQINFDDD